MMVRIVLLWLLLLWFFLPGGFHPVFAESDLESLKKEIAEQREKLAEQMRELEALEKRLDEVTQSEVGR